MRALMSLDISKNYIGAHYDGSKWVSTPEGSCLSSNNATSYMPLVYIWIGPKAIADAIRDNMVISTVIMHKFPLPIQDIKTKVELELSMKELNSLDAVVLAALLPLNVSGTAFGYRCYR
jgi:hypothetical protein